MNGIWRFVGVSVGAALIALGVPLFLTPFPGGLAAMVFGAGLVLTWSTPAQRFVREKREHHPKLDRRLHRLGKRVPEPLRAPLEKTDPKER